jgi:hypothetical protein
LESIVVAAGSNVERGISSSDAAASLALRLKCKGTCAAVEGEQLRVRDLAASVGAASAREEEDLVTRLTPGIEVEASLGQSAHDNDGSGAVIVLAGGDNVPPLAVGAAAVCDLHGREVGAEVAGEGVHEETASIRGFDLDV